MWLLGLLVVLAAVMIAVTVSRGRRARKSWDVRIAGLVAESTWLAHDLLPNTLSTPGAAERHATWTAYRPRVEALGNNLTEAAADAPEDRWGELDRLRVAVADVGSAMDLYAAVAPTNGEESLGAVRQAQRVLEEVLQAIQQRDRALRSAGERG